ncbi:MAG: type III-A CRISPR-associated RAMP protein Csm3 [Methanobrevibacter sp.]|jgi:CRISPR-associated protein Csm3|nr:type III-A CRISPR-associated RAMP protein Csm3 [Candidatus Methanovirga australis]
MFKENYLIKGTIVCETGLHIGGSNETIEIGGSDNVIIRDSISGFPFIPGSSLKGKLRYLLELSDKESAKSVIANGGGVADSPNCVVSKIFGTSPDENMNATPENLMKTRLIVRDSFPTEDSLQLWENGVEILKGAELKYENTINRITSAANPRNMERVPKGSKFSFEMILSVYDGDDFNLSSLFEAINLLEDSYLGGSGSRGYGKVGFEDITLIKRDVSYYKGDAESELFKDLSINDAKKEISKLREEFEKN